MKRESAEYIAKKHFNLMNPSMWNGLGKMPADFDGRIVTYPLTDDTELDISFEKEERPDTGKKSWSHYCELRVAGERDDLLECCHGYSIDSVNDLVDTILDVCMGYELNKADIKLFESQRNLKVSELDVPESNAIFLALYEKYKSHGLEKGQVFESIKGVMNDTVSNLEKILNVDYMEREKTKIPSEKELRFIPQMVIPESDLDVKTYMDEDIFKKSVAVLLEDEIFKVERLRGSVTQGEAAVYCNGQKIVQYGDKICLRCKNGTWSDAMAMKEIPDSSLEAGEYGPEIGGYRSINPDHKLVSSAIVVYPKEVHHAVLKDILQVGLSEKIEKASQKIQPGQTNRTSHKKDLSK